MLQIGTYAWSEKTGSGGRIIGLQGSKARVRAADRKIRIFSTKNLTGISRRTFGRRTGVSSLPLKS